MNSYLRKDGKTMTEEINDITRCIRGVRYARQLPNSVATKILEVLYDKLAELEGPKSLAEELKQSRDKEFGRQFGKLLKEYNVEAKIREMAKQGFNKVTFDMKQGFDKNLFRDPRFTPAIKSKFGSEFKVIHDTGDIFALGYTIGRKDIYVITWT